MKSISSSVSGWGWILGGLLRADYLWNSLWRRGGGRSVVALYESEGATGRNCLPPQFAIPGQLREGSSKKGKEIFEKSYLFDSVFRRT